MHRASTIVMSYLSTVQENAPSERELVSFVKYIIIKTNGNLAQAIDVDKLWADFKAI